MNTEVVPGPPTARSSDTTGQGYRRSHTVLDREIKGTSCTRESRVHPVKECVVGIAGWPRPYGRRHDLMSLPLCLIGSHGDSSETTGLPFQ